MSVMDMFRPRVKKLSSSDTFRLSQEGIEKLKDGGNDPRARIMMALEARGTSNMDEISDASNIRRGLVERILPGLLSGGYVQRVGGSAQVEDF